MKKIIILLILPALLSVLAADNIDIDFSGKFCGMELINNQTERLDIRAETNELKQLVVATSQGEFSELIIPGFGFAGEPGTPKLPVKRELIAVPLGAVLNVEVLDFQSNVYDLQDIGISFQILPMQPPVSKSSAPKDLVFAFDDRAYNSDKWYGDDIISTQEIGILRGLRIFSITYHPISYNPSQNKVRICNSVNTSVAFVGSDFAATDYLRQKTWSPVYEKLYAGFVLNYSTVTSRDDITRYPIKYVIISHSMFEAQLQPFIEWKTMQGYQVTEAYTSEIGSSTTAIAAFISSLWNEATPTDPAPSFILFVGDTAQIPAYSGSQGSHVTDLNYVRLEGADFMPEIYYGRFSARTAAELQPQIDKTLEYEMFTMPDPSYLEEVVMIAGMDSSHGYNWGNGQINYGTNNYFNAAHGITSHTYLYPASGSSSGQIIQNVSDGVGYINYTAHGSSTSWSDPSFTISNINNLQNNHKYPLAVGNCCLTNKFEIGECFGEAWLREPDGGAIGYIGGTNSTYWDEDFWWGVGSGAISSNPTYDGSGPGAYDGMFHDHGEEFSQWYTSQSSFIMAGNLAVVQGGSGMINYYWEIYSLMGDPSLSPYFGMPEVNSAAHDNQIFIGSTQFAITAAPFSYIGLSMNGELIAAGLIEASGTAVFDFPPIANTGTLHLVVTCQNHIPYFAEIAAIPNEGAFLSINDFYISSSNGDDLIEYGETIILNLDLENAGVETASNITAVMSIEDPFITVTNSSINFAAIEPGEIGTLSGFEFDVDYSIPDLHVFQADFVFTYNQNTNSAVIDLTAHAPVIELGNVYILSDDNNNGRLDPGETADMELEIVNSGTSLLESVITMVETSSEFISIYNTWSFIAEILPGESGFYPFLVEVSDNCPIGESVFFTVDVTANNGLSHTGSFNLNIGLNLEDFESGNLNEWEWITSGNADWFVTNQAPYEGVFAAESGDIGNNQISSLSIVLDVLYDDEISFYRKVSSENNWDFLLFFIDGVQMDSWSGNLGWNQVSYPVSAGSHEFSWVYDKDGSVSSGSDCAWLDYIVFPPIGIPQPPQMTCSVDMINQILDINSSASQNFTISNSGGGTLGYYLSIVETNRSIAGSSLTCEAQTYIPGETITWNFEVYNNSSDAEWLTDIGIDFPNGVNVTTATNFTGGSGDLVYNGNTGNAASVEWNDPNGGWGEIHGGETASAEVTVIINSNQTGNIVLNWTLTGDDYGSAPHQIAGSVTLSTEIIPLDWVNLSQYNGSLNSGNSDQITINFNSTSLSPGIYSADLIINDNRIITTIPVILNVDGYIPYGDVDDNGFVEALDASLILQYTVGLNPSPFAPLP
jgi:hypothetical protein